MSSGNAMAGLGDTRPAGKYRKGRGGRSIVGGESVMPLPGAGGSGGGQSSATGLPDQVMQ